MIEVSLVDELIYNGDILLEASRVGVPLELLVQLHKGIRFAWRGGGLANKHQTCVEQDYGSQQVVVNHFCANFE